MLILKNQLFIQFIQFINIDVASQGLYKIIVQILPDQIPGIKGLKKTNRQSFRSFRKSFKQNFNCNLCNTFYSQPFLLKYNNQVISLKTQSHLFEPSTFHQQQIKIKISLLKMQIDQKKPLQAPITQCGQTKIVSSYLLQGSINQGIMEYFQLRSSFPQCFTISMLIYSLPSQLRIAPQQTAIQNDDIKILRKQVKKYRYFSYIIGKMIHQKVKSNSNKQYKIKLPKYFMRSIGQNIRSQATEQQFNQYLINYNKYETDIFQIVQEFQLIGQNNQQIFDDLTSYFLTDNFNCDKQKQIYQNKKSKIFKQSIFQIDQKLTQKDRKNKFSKIRKLFLQIQNITQQGKSLKLVEDNSIKPIFLIESQILKQQKNKEKQQVNIQNHKPLIIFGHGYQASRKDLRDLKNSFKKVIGRGHYLILSSYTKFMSQGIQKMGIRAANQIIAFINQNKMENLKFKVFMIGHSLGGLILRSGLKHLKQYKNNFQCFVSINVPNTGYVKGLSWLLNTGLKFHQRITPAKCLQELVFQDSLDNIIQSQVYKLSKQGRLGNFKKLILISSPDDGYVPTQVARLQKRKKPKDEKQQMFNQIIDNILQGQSLQKIYRCQIDFDIKQKNLNTFLGRTAHVSFLGNQLASQMLLDYCRNIFVVNLQTK